MAKEAHPSLAGLSTLRSLCYALVFAEMYGQVRAWDILYMHAELGIFANTWAGFCFYGYRIAIDVDI